MKISEKLKTGLTNAEKIECYKQILKGYENKTIYTGICGALNGLFSDGQDYDYKDSSSLFPESLAKRPRYITMGYWFEDDTERIQVLNELIAELS